MLLITASGRPSKGVTLAGDRHRIRKITAMGSLPTLPSTRSTTSGRCECGVQGGRPTGPPGNPAVARRSVSIVRYADNSVTGIESAADAPDAGDPQGTPGKVWLDLTPQDKTRLTRDGRFIVKWKTEANACAS